VNRDFQNARASFGKMLIARAESLGQACAEGEAQLLADAAADLLPGDIAATADGATITLTGPRLSARWNGSASRAPDSRFAVWTGVFGSGGGS